MRNGMLKMVAISLLPLLFLLSGCGGGGGGGGGGAEVSGSTLAVTSTSPADGATDVPTGTTVSATFNAALNPATVSSSVLTLNSGGSSVPGNVAYNSATKTLVFTPSPPLANGTSYTATVTVGVKDLAGNSLPAPKIWSFVTATTGSGGGGGGGF